MVIASRGQRENDDGSRESVTDPGLLADLRVRSRRVWAMVISATIVAGAMLLAAPFPLVAVRE